MFTAHEWLTLLIFRHENAVFYAFGFYLRDCVLGAGSDELPHSHAVSGLG